MTCEFAQARPVDANPRDGELLEQAFEAASLRTHDLTELVYERFFAKRPDALELFQVDGMSRGHMLSEIIFLLLDSAGGKDYVTVNITTAVQDHMTYGIFDPSLYADFFDALRDTIIELAGHAWTAEIGEAWQRQCQKVMNMLPDAETFAKHACAAR